MAWFARVSRLEIDWGPAIDPKKADGAPPRAKANG